MSLLPHLAPRRSGTFDPFPFDSSECIPLSEFLAGGAVFTQAKVDWRETPAAHVFKADVPGLRKEEVKVEIEDGRVLQISGERIAEKEERSDTWHKIERSSGKFVRRFRLPENARVDQVKAAMDNGVLTVTVPKEEAGKPDVRSIQITG